MNDPHVKISGKKQEVESCNLITDSTGLSRSMYPDRPVGHLPLSIAGLALMALTDFLCN